MEFHPWRSYRSVEIISPAVNTNLGGVGLHLTDTPVGEFADAVRAQLGEGQREITYGTSTKVSTVAREELDTLSGRMNQ